MPAVARTARALTVAVATACASSPAQQRQCARIAARQSATEVLTLARAETSPELVCLLEAELRCARHAELRDGSVQGARYIGR